MPNETTRRIARYRKMAGLTQNETAQALGIKRSTYARMETQGNPRLDMIKDLANLFGVTVDQIMYGETVNTEKASIQVVNHPLETQTHILQEPAPLEKQSLPFTPTAKEINIIKILRSLPRESYAKAVKYLESVYNELKDTKS